MPNFRYGDRSYDYSVSYLESRKKSIAIHVLPNASVEILVPAHASNERILAALKKRSRWIARHVDQIHEQRLYVLPREYISGETHFYLGRRYQLKVIQSDNDQVRLQRGYFWVEAERTDPEYVKHMLCRWYQDHAKQVFKRRMGEIIGSIPWVDEAPPMTVRLMTKQWGSCSPKGSVSLNWNLVKAPMDCIDYVITHELCHLQEHNHSKGFYALMGRFYPGWESIKNKLDAMAELFLNE